MLETFKSLQKYNFWAEKTDLSIGYPRKTYLKRLESYLGNRLIKVIVGQRRAGKSYILRQIIRKILSLKVNPRNIFYLNKELVEFDKVRTYQDIQKLLDFTHKQLKVKGKSYIFLDEVQEITGWEKLVNSLSQDYKKEYEVFITGSNSTMLSGELASRLSGRYVSFEVLPFAFEEYVDFLGVEPSRTNYLKYLQTGGLPELFHLPDEETKRHYLTSLKDTILFKDIVQRYQIKDAVLLEHIFLYLLDNVGHLFSLNKVVNFILSNRQKTNHETVANYVHYLEQSYLIHEASRFDVRGKTILSGSKKYYVNDLSFRNYLSSSFEKGLSTHLENGIYLYYRRRGYHIFVGSLRGQEIDFVVEKDKEKKYIQVAYSLNDPKVLKREFYPLEAIRDNYEKLVVSLDEISLGSKEGIRHVLAWELPPL